MSVSMILSFPLILSGQVIEAKYDTSCYPNLYFSTLTDLSRWDNPHFFCLDNSSTRGHVDHNVCGNVKNPFFGSTMWEHAGIHDPCRGFFIIFFFRGEPDFAQYRAYFPQFASTKWYRREWGNTSDKTPHSVVNIMSCVWQSCPLLSENTHQNNSLLPLVKSYALIDQLFGGEIREIGSDMFSCFFFAGNIASTGRKTYWKATMLLTR